VSLVPRALLYLVALFLVMIVYTGQKHSAPGPILRASVRMTAKLFAWSVLGVVVMLALEAVFID
jgi:hypothetical protein